jgi:prepilin-type N-terminal cleavage/methylation domain-containing protein
VPRVFRMTDKVYGQQGFTLVELLVVIAVTGLVAGVMALMFNVVTKISTTSTSQNIVLSQVQEAGSWITRDIMSSDNITIYASGNRVATIVRYMWNGTDFTQAVINYDVINNKLLRTVEPEAGRIIAQFISPHGSGTDLTASTGVSENHTYIFNVQSVYAGSSFSRSYKINQRVAGP